MYDYSNLIAAIVGLIVVGGAIWGTAFWDRRTRKMQADYAESLRKTEEFPNTWNSPEKASASKPTLTLRFDN